MNERTLYAMLHKRYAQHAVLVERLERRLGISENRLMAVQEEQVMRKIMKGRQDRRIVLGRPSLRTESLRLERRVNALKKEIMILKEKRLEIRIVLGDADALTRGGYRNSIFPDPHETLDNVGNELNDRIRRIPVDAGGE